MLFCKKTPSQKEYNSIDAYIEEYKIVTNKITSLSLKFSNGSYIIPISMIVGLVSFTLNHYIVNTVLLVVPIVLTFFLYNHVRYMALQFKLSGYAKFLEIKINEALKENVLLWENSIARGNGQNLYEGIFFGITYTSIVLLLYYLAYNRLGVMIFASEISYGVLFSITIIYYFSLASLVFFLLFFTSEHKAAFENANTAFKAPFVPQKNGSGFPFINRISIKLIIVLTIFFSFPIAILPLVFLSPNYIDTIDNYDYIVVLGNKSENNTPSHDMRSRLDCLISYIDGNSDAVVVLSGGNGEATLMKEYIVDNGMGDLQIITEEESSNTYENL